MIIFYGKWKVWNAFVELCKHLNKECILMDDEDRDDKKLTDAQIIVPTPGVSQLHDVYTIFGDKIISELDYLWSIIKENKIDVYTIGITGTDGKSTVTWIIAQALKMLLKGHHIHIPGNFEDPMSQTILEILQSGEKEKNIFVTECSSFMLYPTKQFHFNIGVWTNFATDHLNWHPNMDEYFSAKQRMISLSTHAYASADIFEKLTHDLQEKTEIYPTTYDLHKTHFVGKHNQKNMALAFQVILRTCNEILWVGTVSSDKINAALESTYPLEHRLQPVKTIQEITWYDDGKSTSAQSLGAALESFNEPIIAICGWSDKWDSFDHLKDSFSRTTHGIFLWATAPQFASLFEQRGKPYTIAQSMQECVALARLAAKQHNAKVILFSPGCASFGMFKNYKDRAEQFLSAVEKIEE